jgi:hypothetical protein
MQFAMYLKRQVLHQGQIEATEVLTATSGSLPGEFYGKPTIILNDKDIRRGRRKGTKQISK